MAYKIDAETCINCAACIPECDNEAITEKDDNTLIDPDKCCECVGFAKSPKCVEICPIDDCCILDPDHVESREQLLDKWQRLHPDETPTVT